jgi:hypothetical protein
VKSIRTNISTLRQIVELIPGHLVKKISIKHGVDKKSRSFTPWSHVVSLLFSQLSHALSLNDVCDSLKNHISMLKTIRGAVSLRLKPADNNSSACFIFLSVKTFPLRLPFPLSPPINPSVPNLLYFCLLRIILLFET